MVKNKQEMQPIGLTAKYSNDYINQPIFAQIKIMLNEAIGNAISSTDDSATNTVSISFDIDRDLNTEGQIVKKTGEVIRAFMPIEAKIALTTKKKIINEKVKTESFTALDDPLLGTKVESLQPNLFDQD